MQLTKEQINRNRIIENCERLIRLSQKTIDLETERIKQLKNDIKALQGLDYYKPKQ